jgi:hypothetical protein
MYEVRNIKGHVFVLRVAILPLYIIFLLNFVTAICQIGLRPAMVEKVDFWLQI